MAEDIEYKFVSNSGNGKQSRHSGKFGRMDTNTPKEKLNTSKGWIDFGKKNDFPQEVMALYQNADSVHTSVLDKNINMIAAHGWTPIPALEDFIKNEAAGCTLNEVAWDVAFNDVLFGGYHLNLVWDEDGEIIAKIKCVPYQNVRVGIPIVAGCDVPDNFYISRDWLNPNKIENKPIQYMAFDDSDTDEGKQKRKDYPSQILFVRTNVAGMEWYTLPRYNSTITKIRLSYEAWGFQLKSAVKSYKPGVIATIPWIPTEEQQETILADLNGKNNDDSGDAVILCGPNKESMPTLEFPVLQNSDKRYLEIFDKIDQQIHVGDGTNYVVANIAVAGKLGSTSEVLEQYQIHQATVISPYQTKIEAVFNRIARINILPEEMKLENYIKYLAEYLQNLATQNDASKKIVVAINALNPIVAQKVLDAMTPDEIRSIVGLPSTTPAVLPIDSPTPNITE